MALPTLVEITDHVTASLRSQQEFADERFEIGPDPFFPPRLKIVNSRTARSHARRVVDRYGELRHYELKLNVFFPSNYQVLGLEEYPSFADQPLVGSFRTNSWQLYLDCIIAHELAHCIEMYFQYHGLNHPLRKEYYQPRSKHHGPVFLAIYRILREEFVNPLIKEVGGGPEFIVNDLGERLAGMPKSPLTGIRFKIKNINYEVVGYNPNTSKRLNRYMIRAVDSGHNFGVKLLTIVANSPEATELVKSNAELRAEFIAHHAAVVAKKEANQKSSQTKQRRRNQGVVA